MWDYIGQLFVIVVFSFFLYLSGTVLVRAWKTGMVYLNRVQTNRQEEPGMFWIGVSMALLSAILSLGVVVAVFSSILGTIE